MMFHRFILILIALGSFIVSPARSQAAVETICPGVGIQDVAPGFQPGGIILTTFDRAALWVFDIDRLRRYPLPETVPCTRNCRLSPDARWITYFNDATNAFNRMRVNGTERTLITEYASDVEWWSDDTYLIWTPAGSAYLLPHDGGEREVLDASGAISVQPGGRWGVVVEQNGDTFRRALINLELRGLEGVNDGRLVLGEDRAYYNAQAWSPDGHWLAYIAPAEVAGTSAPGGELFAVAPGDSAPVQWTDLASLYGAARINGLAVGELAWSPDSTRLAFWVTEITGSDPLSNLGTAAIHMLDVATGDLSVYCGYSTTEHTPNPPRLVWSPDGTHLAFGGNVPGDDRGYLLLVLNAATGVFTSMSEGIYPAFGSADVVAWGLAPG
jgi:hypothetical protein